MTKLLNQTIQDLGEQLKGKICCNTWGCVRSSCAKLCSRLPSNLLLSRGYWCQKCEPVTTAAAEDSGSTS